jgi:hypothetical protein
VLVERHVKSGLLSTDSGKVAKLLVFLLVEIVDLQLTFGSDGSEDGWWVGSPLNITNGASQIVTHNRAGHVDHPHFDSPIGRATQEDLGVESVPFNGVNSKVMALISLEILAREGFRAQMNLSFFSSNQELSVVVGVEVEAHTSGKTIGKSLFFIILKFLVLVDNELKLDDFLGFKFVLH